MNLYEYKIAESIGGRQEQQDHAGAAYTNWGLLVVVCDGMGGAKGGTTASQLAVNLLLNDIKNTAYQSPEDALIQSIRKANAEIFNRSRNDENLRGMGTTVAAIILTEQKAVVAHVGDSRVYQLRPQGLAGKTMQKVFRTDDHSKVFELVKRGILTEEQARISEESNVINKALGIKPDIEPEIHSDLPYLKGDRFLLCTDGVSGEVPENELLHMLRGKKTVESTVNKLISTIDQQGHRQGGGHDNLTAALIECHTKSTIKQKMTRTKLYIGLLAILLLAALGYIGFSEYTKRSQSPDDVRNYKNENEALKGRIDSLIEINTSLTKLLEEEREKLNGIKRALNGETDAKETPENPKSSGNADQLSAGKPEQTKDAPAQKERGSASEPKSAEP